MYFLYLELTFTPHYIITDKGLLTQLETLLDQETNLLSCITCERGR